MGGVAAWLGTEPWLPSLDAIEPLDATVSPPPLCILPCAAEIAAHATSTTPIKAAKPVMPPTGSALGNAPALNGFSLKDFAQWDKADKYE